MKRLFFIGLILALGLMLGVSNAIATPQQVHLSWSTNDVYRTMTMMWWTELPGESKVVYDLMPQESPKNYAFTTEGTAYQIKPAKDRHGEPIATQFTGFYHETRLTDLEPGTDYYFRVGGSDGYSQEWSFRTIGLGQKVKFIIGGDSRRPYGAGYEVKVSPKVISNWPWSRDWVTTCAAEEGPDFVVFIGDMVNEGSIQENWSNWFESFQDRLVKDKRMIPIIAVIGNHEMGVYPDEESTYEWFKGVYANPGNELTFSLDFPNLHITNLCATGGCIATWWEPTLEEAKAQVDFLKDDLANSDAEWKIVVFHVPYYSCFLTGTGYASEPLLKYWSPVIENPIYGVDIVATGHVHNYLRSWPMRTLAIQEVPVDKDWTKVGYKAVYELLNNSAEGVTYIVQGGWGAPNDPYIKGTDCDLRPFIAAAAARACYTLAEITENGLHLVTKDTADTILDEITLHYTTTQFTEPEFENVIW